MSSPLLINESPLQVLPSLAMAVGLNEAIILQQIHYWIDNKAKNVEKYRANSFFEEQWWVWNSIAEWQAAFPFWSDNTIRRAINGLREQGVLIAKHFSPNPYDKTFYYRIDYDALNSLTSAVQKPKGSSRGRAEAEAKRSAENEQSDLPNMSKSSSAQNGQTEVPRMSKSLSKTSPENSKQRIRLRSAPAGASEFSASLFQEKKEPDKTPDHGRRAMREATELLRRRAGKTTLIEAVEVRP